MSVYGSDEGEETVREQTIKQNFARSMSLQDAMNPENLLCYEMNGKPLPQANGYPVRLIAPGWYGIANVKWLKRIEIMNTRFMGRFMGRDYVTLRAEQRGGETVWVERSVGRTLLKSAPAWVVHTAAGTYRIDGAPGSRKRLPTGRATAKSNGKCIFPHKSGFVAQIDQQVKWSLEPCFQPTG